EPEAVPDLRRHHERDGQVTAVHRWRHLGGDGRLSRHAGSRLPFRRADQVLTATGSGTAGNVCRPQDKKTILGDSMKTKIDRPVVWAMVLCAAALAACDSVKDVRSEPSTALPTEKVVLRGVINGLGGGRGITVRYNASAVPTSFIGADPSHPTDVPVPIPFSFGSLDEGTAYNVEITGQPFGKDCVVTSGNAGTLAKGQDTNIVIDCTPNIPRRDLTVTSPPTPAVFK